MSRPVPHVPPRREIVRFACAASVAATAFVFILLAVETPLVAAARLAVIVSLVLIALWLVERRLARKIERLERAEYWRVYSDVMTDLGGLDGEPSGEIPAPPRR